LCDPDGELLAVMDRPGWQRISVRRMREIGEELVSVCEGHGLWEAEASVTCRT
jgi:hypothetical protein